MYCNDNPLVTSHLMVIDIGIIRPVIRWQKGRLNIGQRSFLRWEIQHINIYCNHLMVIDIGIFRPVIRWQNGKLNIDQRSFFSLDKRGNLAF